MRLGATALREEDRDGKRLLGMVDMLDAVGECCFLIFECFMLISRLVVVYLNWVASGVEPATWVRFSMERYCRSK